MVQMIAGWLRRRERRSAPGPRRLAVVWAPRDGRPRHLVWFRNMERPQVERIQIMARENGWITGKTFSPNRRLARRGYSWGFYVYDRPKQDRRQLLETLQRWMPADNAAA